MALKFQSRDFLDIRQELREELSSLLEGKWNDSDESDALSILIDQLAYMQDNLHFYIDQQKRESDIVTATRLRNVWAKALRDGYKPHIYRAAHGNVTIRFSGVPSEIEDRFIAIHKGDRFQTSEKGPSGTIVEFMATDNFALIPRKEIKGDDSDPKFNGFTRIYALDTVGTVKEFDVPVVQGRMSSMSRPISELVDNGYIRISNPTVAEGSVSVSLAGVPWEEIDDVNTSFQTGRYFSVYPQWMNDGLYIILQFGMDFMKYVPASGSFDISYIDTDGPNGNVGRSRMVSEADGYEIYSGGVDSFDFSVMLDDGTDVTPYISCFNRDPIGGGYALESISSIKSNFKRSIRNISALITLKDYEDLAKECSSRSAKAIDWSFAPGYKYFSTDPSDGDARVIFVFVDLDSESDQYRDYVKIKKYFNDLGKTIYDRKYRDEYKNFQGDGDVPSYQSVWDSGALSGLFSKANERMGRGDKVYFFGPEYIGYPISARILLEKTGEPIETVMFSILSDLEYRFSNETEELKTHYCSDIVRTIQNASERIKSVRLITPADDMGADSEKFLRYYIRKGGFEFIVEGAEDEPVIMPSEEINPQFDL